MVILPCFLHQQPEGEELVCAPSALAEATLILTQESLSSGLDPIQKYTSEHLAGDAQRAMPL